MEQYHTQSFLQTAVMAWRGGIPHPRDERYHSKYAKFYQALSGTKNGRVLAEEWGPNLGTKFICAGHT